MSENMRFHDDVCWINVIQGDNIYVFRESYRIQIYSTQWGGKCQACNNIVGVTYYCHCVYKVNACFKVR